MPRSVAASLKIITTTTPSSYAQNCGQEIQYSPLLCVSIDFLPEKSPIIFARQVECRFVELSHSSTLASTKGDTAATLATQAPIAVVVSTHRQNCQVSGDVTHHQSKSHSTQ